MNQQTGETETYTLSGECKRYGLPLPVDDVPIWVAFDGLMRHIYANHDLVDAANQRTIATYKSRWSTVVNYLSEVAGMSARADAAFSHEAHAHEVRELNAIKRWAESFLRWSQNTIENEAQSGRDGGDA